MTLKEDWDSEDYTEPAPISGMRDGFRYFADNGMVSRAEWAMFVREGTAYLNKVYSTGEKEYVDLEEGCAAYKQILDTGTTAQGALEFVAKELHKSPEWVEEVKDRYYKHASKVVLLHDNHPIQKKMLKSGTMDKKALKASNTANSQLIRLHKQMKLQATLEKLESSDQELKDEIGELKAKALVTDTDVNDIISQLDIKVKSLGEKAYILKQAQYSQKQIASTLGVSISTARRAYLQYRESLEMHSESSNELK